MDHKLWSISHNSIIDKIIQGSRYFWIHKISREDILLIPEFNLNPLAVRLVQFLFTINFIHSSVLLEYLCQAMKENARLSIFAIFWRTFNQHGKTLRIPCRIQLCQRYVQFSDFLICQIMEPSQRNDKYNVFAIFVIHLLYFTKARNS